MHRPVTKITLVPLAAALFLCLTEGTWAQSEKPSDPTPKPASSTEAALGAKPKLTPEELEAKFKATLTKATMAGRWCSTTGGVLGPEKSDKYAIVGVTKLGGDSWVIQARIQYDQKDIVAPIPIQVKWAGDTAVITVDNIPVPGGGTYSARVLVYDQTYAGTWTGGDHGGLIYGLITHDGAPKSSEGK